MGWGSQTFVYFAKNLSRVEGGEWYWVLITGCISIVLWDASLILWVASLHPPSLFSHPSFASDDVPPINSQLFRLRLQEPKCFPIFPYSRILLMLQPIIVLRVSCLPEYYSIFHFHPSVRHRRDITHFLQYMMI